MRTQIPNLPLKAIKAFISAGLIENGLTIPFLVGVYHRHTPIDLSSSKCIKIIIDDIVNDPNEQKYTLKKCDGTVVGEFVLAQYDNELSQRHLCNVYGQEILYLTGNIPEVPVTIDGLVEYLYDKYREEVKDEKFSKRDRKWESFNPVEQRIIDDVFAQG